MTRLMKDTPEVRALMVLAYAHSIMEDLLSDCAMIGAPPPMDLAEYGDDAVSLGDRFEETTLQGNAPQWSLGAGGNDKEIAPVARAFREDAERLVNEWLRTDWRERHIRALAAAFTTIVRRELTPEQLATVLRRNRDESNPGVCHTHDFADANEFMASAFSEVFGHEVDPNDDEHTFYWNRAWDIAKRADFNA